MKFPSQKFLQPGVFALVFALALPGCATGPSSSSSSKPFTNHDRAELLVQAAAAAIQEGDPTGALQLLKDAAKYAPEMPQVYLARATAFYAKKEIGPALDNVREAIRLQPNYSGAHNTLGRFLLDQGKLKEAEKELLLATGDSLSRDLYKAYSNLGILYYRQGKDSLAMAALSKAIVEGKDAACIAYYYRGHLRLKTGVYNEAIRDYSSATRRICGSFAEAHLALATAYERSRQFDMARKKYVEIRQNFPNTRVAEEAMGRLRNVP